MVVTEQTVQVNIIEIVAGEAMKRCRSSLKLWDNNVLKTEDEEHGGSSANLQQLAGKHTSNGRLTGR